MGVKRDPAGGFTEVQYSKPQEVQHGTILRPAGPKMIIESWAKNVGLEMFPAHSGMGWEFSPIIPNFDEMYALYKHKGKWYVEVGPGEQDPDSPSPFDTLDEALDYLDEERQKQIEFLKSHPEEAENRPQ